MQSRFGMFPFVAENREWVEIFLDERVLGDIIRRRKPSTFFWCDMTDLFGKWVPDEWIDRCAATCALTPQHTHLWLTKRAGRMRQYLALLSRCEYMDARIMDAAEGLMLSNDLRKLSWDLPAWPLPNVWLGVSVEDQATADDRIPLLLQTPAEVRFVSLEPMLSRVDLSRWIGYNPLHEEIQREAGLRSSGFKGTGDRRSGPDLENRKTRLGQMEVPSRDANLYQGAGRASDPAGLPSGSCDVREREIVHLGSSAGLDALQRTYSRGKDHQPQEREEVGQSPSESGVGNIFRAGDSRPAGLESREDRPERRKKRHRQVDNAGRERDQSEKIGRRAIEVDSQGLRDSLSDGIETCAVEELASLDLVIVGGESGPGARPMVTEWPRAIRDQCQAAGVPFFFKQWGEWAPTFNNDTSHGRMPRYLDVPIGDGTHRRMFLVGKRTAGRLLDGREWNEKPEAR